MFVSFFQQMFLRADKAMPPAAADGREDAAPARDAKAPPRDPRSSRRHRRPPARPPRSG